LSQGNQASGYELRMTVGTVNGTLGCACGFFKVTKNTDGTWSYYSFGLQWASYFNGGSPGIGIYKVDHGVATTLALYTVPAPSTGEVIAARLQLSDINGPSKGITVRYKGQSYYGRVSDANMLVTGRNGFAPFGLTRIQMGYADTTPPAAVTTSSIQGSYANGVISLQWGASSDNNGGIGMVKYDIFRDGVYQGTTDQTSYSMAASVGTSIQVGVQAWDAHRSFATLSTQTVTANGGVNPGTGNISDSRRVGVSSLGSHWGGMGEQIDTRSMNLNFSIPLLSPVGRGGVTVPVALSYNSQNWRKDNATTWKIGADLGYGFGWRLAAGSVIPVYVNSVLSYYVFTDATGAEYKLDQNSGNVWRGTDGVYVWYDANTARLWFKNGSYWQMDCVSGGQEQDAGTRYPVRVQDTHGNYIVLSYQSATGGGSPPNTSSRLLTIEDSRAVQLNIGSTPAVYRTYLFTYNTDAIPHLTGISNDIQSTEKYSFSYTSDAPLFEPFSGTIQSGSAKRLASYSTLFTLFNLTQTFSYNTSGELTKVVFPQGGELRWNYITQTFVNNRQIREVGSREFVKASGAAAATYSFVHPSGVSSLKMHQETTMLDPGGVGRRLWAFSTANDYREGLELKYEEQDLVSGSWVVKGRRENTWAQSSTSHKYVSEVLNSIDPGGAFQKQSKSTQSIDGYGNVLSSVFYGYGSLTTPLRTTTCSYTLNNNSNYTARYLLGLPTYCSTMENGVTLPGAALTYDGGFGSTTLSDMVGPVRLWTDPGTIYRGLVTSATVGTTTTSSTYNKGGQPVTGNDNAGYSQTTQYGGAAGSVVPVMITPNNNSSLSTSMNWNSFLGLSSVSGPNGASSSATYTNDGLPQYKTSPDGALTTMSFFANPFYTMSSVNGRWTKTWQDGIGRTVKVESGDAGGTKSIVDTEYEPCACSPMGKVKRVSLPYAPGGTVYWTTYTFDGLGRVLTVAQPNGAGTTTYLYQGNTVRVTSPSGKWKQHEMNALGQLVKVTEPRPGGGTYETSYTYNITGKLVGVSMPRDGVTQTRTFQYDTQTYSLLQSATNPENGTVTYVYNADRSLQSKTDAKGIKTEFSYDSYKRVLQVRKLSGNPLLEDRCQRVDYIYDEGPGGAGRLTRTRYGWNVNGQGAEVPCAGPATLASKIGFEERFEYNAAGRILSKRLVYYRVVGSVLRSADLKLDWTYNTDGQATSVTYPFQQQLNSSGEGRPVVNVSYDGMARLTGLTWRGLPWASTDPLPPAQTIASSAVYNARNALTSLNIDGVTETRQYNLLGQLTRITQLGQIDIEYRFSATANDGKITSQRNWISGEEVSYLYDELERLSSATTTGPEWGLSWGYDGFGNRLSQSVTKGSGPTSMTPTNAATNRLTGAGYSYDANGNMTGMPQLNSTMTYDHSNRMVEVTNSNGGEAYIYAPDNRRVWRSQGVDPGQGNAEQVMLYSPGGQLMGVYRVAVGTFPSGATVITRVQENVYWGGRLIYSPGTGRKVTDRLSSVGNGSTYYPYGEYKATGSTNGGTDTDQFATYKRDGKTGLDYADQRYYAAGLGRFGTVDSFAGSFDVYSPLSANRYSYISGDPLNSIDPSGLNPTTTTPTDTIGVWRTCIEYEQGAPQCYVWGHAISTGLSSGGIPNDNGAGFAAAFDSGLQAIRKSFVECQEDADSKRRGELSLLPPGTSELYQGYSNFLAGAGVAIEVAALIPLTKLFKIATISGVEKAAAFAAAQLSMAGDLKNIGAAIVASAIGFTLFYGSDIKAWDLRNPGKNLFALFPEVQKINDSHATMLSKCASDFRKSLSSLASIFHQRVDLNAIHP
jgi:RHS repeat-associated protein